MTPNTLGMAVKAVASEVLTPIEAKSRGAVLGRIVAGQLRTKGKLADRRIVREFEQILQHLIAANGGQYIVTVATAALATLRRERDATPLAGVASAMQPVTPRQCREARRLLGVTQAELGLQLGTSQAVISTFERTGRMTSSQSARVDRIERLRDWFELAGIEFAEQNGLDPGVRLRKAEQ